MNRMRLPATIGFVALAMGLAWLVALPLWSDGGLNSPLFGILVPIMMFTPTIAAIIVLLVFRPVPKGRRLRFLGVWPLRPAKRVVWLTVIGLLAPFVLVVASVLVAALCGWVRLDLIHFSGYAELLAASVPEGTPVPPAGIAILAQLVMIPFAAATVNAFVAFGEELGWRGFLVPALRPLGTWPALLISGAVWGLWHAPIILLGYNFARTDISGVLLTTAGCIAWGILLGWLRLRSASVWPAVFAHGMLNACAALIGLVYAAGTTFDMALAGPLGVAGWIVCAVVILALVITGQFRRQPELAEPSAPQPSPLAGTPPRA